MTYFIEPDWPAPSNIKAFVTTRDMGNAASPVDQKNLRQLLHLPTEPIWLNQVHGQHVLPAEKYHGGDADGSYTKQPGIVCTVRTADCLPLLLCDKAGITVAALHGGWRSLAAGIISNTLSLLNIPPTELLVWLGPAISKTHFEVGDDMRNNMLALHPEAITAFTSTGLQKWHGDLYEMARIQLNQLGVESIYGGDFCTYGEDRFFSYRQDKLTGRMASLIWRQT